MNYRKSVREERLEPSCFISDVLKYYRAVCPKYRLFYWPIQLLCDKFMQLDRDYCGSQFHPGNCDNLQRSNTRFGHN